MNIINQKSLYSIFLINVELTIGKFKTLKFREMVSRKKEPAQEEVKLVLFGKITNSS